MCAGPRNGKNLLIKPASKRVPPESESTRNAVNKNLVDPLATVSWRKIPAEVVKISSGIPEEKNAAHCPE